jgi:AraC-like DNA-binding protein
MRINPWRHVMENFHADHVATVIATSSKDEAIERLRTPLSPHRIRLIGASEQFSARFLAADELAGFQMSTLAFGTEVELEITTADSHLLVTAQTQGSSAVLSQGLQARGGCGFIVIDSTSDPVVKRFSADSARINLRVPRARLNTVWASLTGEHRDPKIVFHPFVFDAQARQRWHSHMRLLMEYGLKADATPARQAEVMTESVLLAMLMEFPHNHSRMLHAPPVRANSAALTAARCFIEDHLQESLCLEGIAAHCGVSIRSLSAVFKHEHGMSVMRYVTEARLQAARRLLLCRQANMTVARAVADCGFSGLGRFAAAYRTRFGELPSRTLACR